MNPNLISVTLDTPSDNERAHSLPRPGRRGSKGARSSASAAAGAGVPGRRVTPVSDKPTVEIWTDGACKGNPGIGGWGALLRSGEHRKELFGGEKATTNNRMELTAVVEALRALKGPSDVTLHVDSQYVMNGMKSWIAGWKRNGWQTAAKKPVKNADLWKALDAEVAEHDVHWVWVKGHAGDPGNERADQLANDGVDSVR
ncbi:ribonuclease HI [Isoptericola sp. JC619]|uniref:Ribonuclease H n=1 Tax=Isoptericola sediminis TaxID=2733572 RepID=A0A849K5P1_9MICO|nr:ribonuclease HI [Isoptericola sediminis]